MPTQPGHPLWIGELSTGDGRGHRYRKKRRVLDNNTPPVSKAAGESAFLVNGSGY